MLKLTAWRNLQCFFHLHFHAQALKYEYSAHRDVLGSAVLGLDDVYKQIRSFKLSLPRSNTPGTRVPLYFVAADVQSCFNTMDQVSGCAVVALNTHTVSQAG